MEHQLPISIKKCASIVIGSTYLYNEQFSIGNQTLQSPGNVTDLGIIIVECGDLTLHAESIQNISNIRDSTFLYFP